MYPVAGVKRLRQLPARCTNLALDSVSPRRLAIWAMAKSAAAYSSVVAAEPQTPAGFTTGVAERAPHVAGPRGRHLRQERDLCSVAAPARDVRVGGAVRIAVDLPAHAHV